MEIKCGNFTIKDVGVDDLAAIFEVYRQCEDFLALGPEPLASEEMVLSDLRYSKEQAGIFCGIFNVGRLVGIVDFVLDNYNGNPGTAYLALLMIAKPYRRKGLGSAVVDAVEKEILKQKNVKTIYAAVQTNNASAMCFWAKMGYKIVSGPKLMPDQTVVYDLRKDVS